MVGYLFKKIIKYWKKMYTFSKENREHIYFK